MNKTDLIVRQLGLQDYQEIWHKMQEFTDNRNAETTDEIWLVEHHPVFTQGQAGKPEHLLQRSDIPVVQSDRGGQITYHGPGQQVMYVLIDIKRHEHLNVRQLVTALEQSVVKTLADYSIEGYPKPDAPGVYIDGKKICSLGLRIRKGCSFLGLRLISIWISILSITLILAAMQGLKCVSLLILSVKKRRHLTRFPQN